MAYILGLIYFQIKKKMLLLSPLFFAYEEIDTNLDRKKDF